MKPLLDNVAEIQLFYRPTTRCSPVITTSKDAYDVLRNWFPNDTFSLQERFVIMYLNRAKRVLGVYELSVGEITGIVVDIRMLISASLKVAATSIIFCHNHPSGKLNPSKQDIDIMRKIVALCQLFDIKVVKSKS